MPDLVVSARLEERVRPNLEIHHWEFQENLELHSASQFTLLKIWISAYKPTQEVKSRMQNTLNTSGETSGGIFRYSRGMNWFRSWTRNIIGQLSVKKIKLDVFSAEIGIAHLG
jgi:hypothetical protein